MNLKKCGGSAITSESAPIAIGFGFAHAQTVNQDVKNATGFQKTINIVNILMFCETNTKQESRTVTEDWIDATKELPKETDIVHVMQDGGHYKDNVLYFAETMKFNCDFEPTHWKNTREKDHD